MNQTVWFSMLAIVAMWGCGGATPEQQVISDAAAALGGRERIEAVKTLVVTGEGTAYAVGSDQLIDTNYRIYTLTGYKHAIDIPGGRALVEQTRIPMTPNFSGQAPARQVQGIDGEVAYNVAANGNRTRAANEVTVRARRANMYHQPDDEFNPQWDFRGIAQDANLLHIVGKRLANSRDWPNWSDDSEFRAKRDESASERGAAAPAPVPATEPAKPPKKGERG